MSKKLKKTCFILMSALIAIFLNAIDTYAITPISEPSYPGIDVSNWQGYVDYRRVAASGIQVVYMKASQGTTFKDPYFETNYANAKANGLKVGFYHYLTATTTEGAEQQARFFVSVISGKVPDCKLVMDYETFGGVGVNQINEIARTFLETVGRLTNKPVIVYSDLSNATNTFNTSIAQNYQLWLAYYGNYNRLNNVNTSWANWIGVQYTSMGEVPGVNGYVDRNNFTQDIFIGETTTIPEMEDVTGGNNTQTIEYTIVRGDTLSAIARRYGTTVQQIAELNNISNPNLIFPGEVLRIITNSNVPGEETGGTGCVIYTVQRGDTLSQIAERFGSTVQRIAMINRIANVNLIYPGEQLKICKIPMEESNENESNVYIVQSGNTLSGIARRYGVTVNYLVTKNNIQNPNLIFPGQRILL